MQYFFRIFFLMILSTISSSVYSVDVVSYAVSLKYPDAKQNYFIDLISKVLAKSEKKYGAYQLNPVDIKMGQERTSVMLERDELVSIAWRMTSTSLEQRLQPIYIPLLNGLMGNRIFIIRKSEQHLFSKDMPLAALKNISTGQGYNWPDTRILQANGFKVEKGSDENLLKMLKAKRFDFFPRALHEPWLEIEHEPFLTVEKNIMLKYAAPIYFFVSKNNNRLYQRIKYGLEKMDKSGELHNYFIHHAVTKSILQKANINERTIYELTNPLLSERTKQILEQRKI